MQVVPTIYVTIIFPLNPAGLNVFPLTPVPLHVPPVVPVSNESRLIGPLFAQREAVVHAAFGPAVTVIEVVADAEQDPGNVYVIVLEPTVATEGSNVPLAPLVIPVPDQVPPAISAVRLKGVTPEHCGPTGVMFGVVFGETVILSVDEPPHGAVPAVYVTAIGPDKPAGSNIFPVTPVPDHVPPGVPVINVFRFIAGSSTHIGGGCDHVGFAEGATSI
jgi:hypothetical protein